MVDFLWIDLKIDIALIYFVVKIFNFERFFNENFEKTLKNSLSLDAEMMRCFNIFAPLTCLMFMFNVQASILNV